MSKLPGTLLTLGKVQYSPADQQLFELNGQEILLRPQTLKVLDFFVQSHGVFQSKDSLLQAVWKGLVVTDSSLVQCVREIRQAIGDEDHSILQTVHKRGYRLHMGRAQPIALAAMAHLPAEPLVPPLALAVMPFASREGDERSEQLAKIFAGDLLTKLTLHPELPLISRQASFAPECQGLSATQISLRLQARYIVSGQLHLTAGGMQFSLEMLDGLSNQLLWADNESGTLNNAQVDSAEAEREALLKRLAAKIQNCFIASRDKLALMDEANSSNLFHHFISAVQVMLRYTPESAVEAERMFALLVAQHPDYPRGLSGHANTLLMDMSHCYTGQTNDECAAKALAELNKAIELDRSYGFSYGLLAHALCCNGRFEEAQVALRKAQDLAPSHAMQLAQRAHVFFFSGQLDLSLQCADESLAVDVESSYSGFGAAHLGRALVFQNNRAKGIELLSEFLVLTPGFNWARMALIVALEEMGEHSKAALHYAELLKYTRNFHRSFFGRLWDAIPNIRDRYIKALGAHGF